MTPSMRLESDEYAAVRDALGTLQGREAGFVTANLRGENRIVGFADTGLQQTYPNLDGLSWLARAKMKLGIHTHGGSLRVPNGVGWFVDGDSVGRSFFSAPQTANG